MLHFLGGVFVSPAPQTAYGYMLERFADKGYLVVSTPFAVDFDYRKPAAEVHAKFIAARLELSKELGELPLLTAGHSLGALMQVLLCTEYPESYGKHVCASALISYNNKPASDAIPLFEQAFVPALAPFEPLTRSQALVDANSAAVVLRQAAFGLSRGLARRSASQIAEAVERSSPAAVRTQVRDAAARVSSATAELDATLRDAEALAALADQVPDVLGQISRGASEFRPSPPEVVALLQGGAYRPPRPLVISFEVDGLDESDSLEAALPDALGATRARLPGTHLTPLAARRLLVPPALRPANLLFDVDGLVARMDSYYATSLAELPERAAAARQEARRDALEAERRQKAEAEDAARAQARAIQAANVEAQLAESAAKTRLAEAGRAKAAAQRAEARAVITSPRLTDSGVVVSTRPIAKARLAVREAKRQEEAARRLATIAAVESRIAEIESLGATAR